MEDPDAPAVHIGRQHVLEHRQSSAGLMAQAADNAAAGVQPGVGGSVRRQGEVVPVILPYALPEKPVAGRTAEGFDPRMLIRGHRLAGQLAANPVGFFGHDDLFAGFGRRQCGRDAAGAAAQDGNVRVEVTFHSSCLLLP
ncbi:hypothetical protein D3C81_1679400 [compost metagenome]